MSGLLFSLIQQSFLLFRLSALDGWSYAHGWLISSMQEALLHFIWKNRLLLPGDWRTQQGERVEVYHPGYHNHDGGPDFTEAMIKIGGQRWMGSVEIHWKAREWYQHQHHTDEHYNNVVLHVVWQGDEVALRTDGTAIPQFALAPWVPLSLLEQHQGLMQSSQALPCAASLGDERWYFQGMLDRAGVERLEHRVAQLEVQLQACKGDWEEAFWRWLAGAMGLKVNREPMEALASSLSVHVLHKYQHDLRSLEALLFGQAGFLNSHPKLSGWPAELHAEYLYLQAKHQLRPMPPTQWRFLRMRPAAFPTRRLAQLAALLHQGMPLFERLRSAAQPTELLAQLQPLPSSYWQQHYRVGDEGGAKGGRPSPATAAVWAINAVVPAMFLFGRWQHLPSEQEKAISWLESLAPEKNQIVHLFEGLQVTPRNALQSQGMVELFKQYCTEKRCLDCIVGNRLLLTKLTDHAKTG